MAALAIRQTTVIEVHIRPALGIVTIGALARIVIGFAVATGAIHHPRVIKVRIAPVLCVVTKATRAVVVVNRR